MHTTPRKEAETRHLPKTCDEPRTIAIIAPAPSKKIPNIHSVVVEYSQVPASFKIQTNTMSGTPRSNIIPMLFVRHMSSCSSDLFT
jgi:hypothetical protein